ncbi:MAG: HAMP domain-containing protein, partial [Melioribacteraceae bacterium]|nr:HAMP domain-containing protein [Melioribacteraceae bacterium]
MRWTISKKLSLGFGIITLIFVVFGLYISSVLNEFEDDSQIAAENQTQLLQVSELKQDVISIWQFITDASLTEDNSVIKGEAKPKYESAKNHIKELLISNNQNDEIVVKLKKLESDLDIFYESGIKMFDAYMVDISMGNLEMESFDRIASAFLGEVDEIVEYKIQFSEESTAEMINMSHSSKSTTYLILFISIIASISIAYFIIKQITKPIALLNDAALRISQKEYNVSVEYFGDDELGVLANTFNKMVDLISIQIGYLDNLPTPIMVIDTEYGIQYMNKKGAQVVGKEQKALIGQKCYDQFKTDHCNTDKCSCAQAMRTNGVVTEETISRPNGGELPIMYTGGPVKNKEG